MSEDQTATLNIVTIGAGRMGRGIAIVFAYAGHSVTMLDFKERPPSDFSKLAEEAKAELHETLTMLSELGMFNGSDAIDTIVQRIKIAPKADAFTVLANTDILFEGVPEVLEMKHDALAEASKLCPATTIIASTTSTILVDDISPCIQHPERFLNAHWLNPAFIVPLVELSPGAKTNDDTVERLKQLLVQVGKVPIVCGAVPGFIVPRLQTVAMNEAARLVEEGVATSEDIEKAVKYGFGFRFSVLGLLEFIDWGGGDILFYASKYLSNALKNERYSAPGVVERNMAEGKIGLKTRKGFLSYEELNIPAYRKQRLAAFIGRLQALDLMKPPAL